MFQRNDWRTIVSDRIVILGAGGLSLGFLAPELRKDYEITFLDTHFKEDFVSSVRKHRAYTTNLAGEKISPATVADVDAFRLDVPEQDAEIRKRIAQARIFYTAVGIRNLDSALGYLNERLAGRSEAIYILCAENGEGVADAWRTKFPGNIHLCDTVMGRMCRLDEHPLPDYQPVTPDVPWGVVGEAFYGLPLSNVHADKEVFHSKAFQFVSPEEFHARERAKLYAHNAMHFYGAALGRLRGVERFSDMAGDAQVTGAVSGLLNEEIAPALWKDSTFHMGRKAFDEYVQRMPGRLFSKTLRDHVARGVRGIQDKFADNERVMGGLRLLLSTGIKPKRYCDLLAAGIAVARKDVSPAAADGLLARLPDDVRADVAERLKNYT